MIELSAAEMAVIIDTLRGSCLIIDNSHGVFAYDGGLRLKVADKVWDILQSIKVEIREGTVETP